MDAFFALPLPLADNNIIGNLEVSLFEAPTPNGSPFASFLYDFDILANPVFGYALQLGPAWADGDGSFTLTALNADAVIGDIAVGRIDGHVAHYAQEVFTPLAAPAVPARRPPALRWALGGDGVVARRRKRKAAAEA